MNRSNRPLERIAQEKHVPGATYRFQFHKDFKFGAATELAGYLKDLGITDCYASPLFKAGPNSTHGYDITGFDQLNPELGGAEEFDKFSAGLRAQGLGLILDMVPNHMGNDLSNGWWVDILELGRASAFASFFDIDWQRSSSRLKNKILLPTLEAPYAQVLESGKIQLAFSDSGFVLSYYDRHFPVAPCSYPALLHGIAERLRGQVDESAELRRQLSRDASLLRQSEQTPGLGVRTFHEIKRRLQSLSQDAREFQEAVRTLLHDLNGTPGKPRSFDRLHRILEEQNYRLAFWRAASDEINYRRFFDVTSLASVRMELPAVFDKTHDLVFQLIGEGKVDGLRIDHPDGLWNPKEYFLRLQKRFLRTRRQKERNAPLLVEYEIGKWLREQMEPFEQEWMSSRAAREDASRANAARAKPLYVVAEKILSANEALPLNWPVDGTTGYDFLNLVNGLFVQPQHKREFDRIYREFTSESSNFEDLVRAGKTKILTRSLVSELETLTTQLEQLARASRYGTDLTRPQLRQTLIELIAAFPVYRTYITEEAETLACQDQIVIELAAEEAKRANPALGAHAFDFVRDLLLLRFPADLDEDAKQGCREWIMRFQQLTGPVTAKGVEDTAFYNYNRLISLNEVGGEPGRFGVKLEEFHQENTLRARHWPHSLLATATHDTKRGEDVRTRIDVLSEMPNEWEAAVGRWRSMNEDKKTPANGNLIPSLNDEYLLYQTLVGAWPFARVDLVSPEKNGRTPRAEPSAGKEKEFTGRIVDYMIKACREAKTNTAWTEPNETYENGLRNFVERILSGANAGFKEELEEFSRVPIYFGQLNSLAQVLLKLTCPGVPDFYQGSELWDLSLVDPDNRRPVDYAQRKKLLDRLKRKSPISLTSLLQESHTGSIKLFVMTQALAFRNKHRPLLDGGEYVPLRATGAKREHVCAFARQLGRTICITVIPRLVSGLMQSDPRLPVGPGVWGDTALELPSPARGFQNVFSGEKVAVDKSGKRILLRDVLNGFPVALLR